MTIESSNAQQNRYSDHNPASLFSHFARFSLVVGCLFSSAGASGDCIFRLGAALRIQRKETPVLNIPNLTRI